MKGPNPFQIALIQEFNERAVSYLVIGGRALQLIGLNRPTRDLDLLISPTPDNARRAFEVLRPRFGLELEGRLATFLDAPGKRIALPHKGEHEVDLLTSVGTLAFATAFSNSEVHALAGNSVHVPCLLDLLYTKVVAYLANSEPQIRERDKRDLELLVGLFPPRDSG